MKRKEKKRRRRTTTTTTKQKRQFFIALKYSDTIHQSLIDHLVDLMFSYHQK
jgi:hypothetical protein